jgi:hypothetical protein
LRGDALDQEFQIGFDRSEIDVLRVTSRDEGKFVWHAIDRARGWVDEQLTPPSTV